MKTLFTILSTLITLIMFWYGYSFCLTAEQSFPIRGYLGTMLPIFGCAFFFFLGRIWYDLS